MSNPDPHGKRGRGKFRVGDTVTYVGDRRLRRVVTERYWDASYPSWRHRFKEFGLSRMRESGYVRLTFKGFLAVRLMEFDYNGVHYSYHGRKLTRTVNRLTASGGPHPRRRDRKASTAELVVWGQAVYDWKAAGQP